MTRLSLPAAVVTLVLAACAYPPAPIADDPTAQAIPVAEIVCERDGSTTVATPEVRAQPDGVHVVVDNRLDEPASIGRFDVNPGSSEWTFGWGPGVHELVCWPFSEHSSGEAPAPLRLRVLDPEGLFVMPPELDCQAWSAHADYATPTTGIADDPIEAARRTLSGLVEGDELAVRRSGYPKGDDQGQATVVVSRAGRLVAIVGTSLADDDRWFAPSASACMDSGIDYG